MENLTFPRVWFLGALFLLTAFPFVAVGQEPLPETDTESGPEAITETETDNPAGILR